MRFEPKIYRPLTGRLQVEIPVRKGEGRTVRPWLWEVCGEDTRSQWDEQSKVWLVARDHLVRVRDALVTKHGVCIVFVDSRLSQRSSCDTRCTDAKDDDCVCQCGGVNHRGSRGGYVQVGDTTLVKRQGSVTTTSRRYERSCRSSDQR